MASGVIAAFFLLTAVLGTRYILQSWSPTGKNVEKLLKQQKYKEALALVESNNAAFGDSSDVLVMTGKIWLSVAWEKMNRDGWKSYGRNPRDWFDVPEAAKAEQVFIRAIENNPANVEAHFFLGTLYMEKGWLSSAEVEFLEVLKNKSDDVRARQNLGVLYTRMNRLELAKRELLDAHRLDPHSSSIVKNLVFLYRFYLDKPDSAMLWANRYLNMEPEGDLDMNIVREEFSSMAARYPEMIPAESQQWKKPQRFKPRSR